MSNQAECTVSAVAALTVQIADFKPELSAARAELRKVLRLSQ
jgi:hypothetical protein